MREEQVEQAVGRVVEKIERTGENLSTEEYKSFLLAVREELDLLISASRLKKGHMPKPSCWEELLFEVMHQDAVYRQQDLQEIAAVWALLEEDIALDEELAQLASGPASPL